MNRQRTVYFDYLRIIAVFAVILSHVAAQNWGNLSVDSPEWQALNFYDAAGRWSVPAFVMISGALFLGKELSIRKLFAKNLLRIVAAFVFWSVVYAVWTNIVINGNDNWKKLLRRIILGHYHLWFLYMIAGLYLIVPLLSKIAEDKKTAWYFVAGSFVFSVLIPQCTQLVGVRHTEIADVIGRVLTKLDVHLLLGYSGYFVLGHLLHELDIKRKYRTVLYLLGILGLAFTIAATSFLSLKAQSPVREVYGEFTVNVCLTSIAAFVFAKSCWNKPPSSEGGRKRLVYLSKCSFGVYLLHPLFMEALDHFLGVNTLSFRPIASVPLLAAGVFSLAMLLSAMLNRIPGLKNWIV